MLMCTMCRVVVVVGLTVFSAQDAASQPALSYPPRPGEGQFIVDEADLIVPDDEARIKAVCEKLLTDKKIPILLVTIESMAQYGTADGDIRVFAANLFNHWGIGFGDWNYGILLLVSRDDRQARIELGADWGHAKDAECQRIMDELIIPRFKAGDYSAGIVAGVDALNGMARDLVPPSRSRPRWQGMADIIVAGIARGALAGGLCEGLCLAARILAEQLPRPSRQ